MSKLFAVLTTFTQTYGKIRKSKKKKQNRAIPSLWKTEKRRKGGNFLNTLRFNRSTSAGKVASPNKR